jgi:hypothetical protein
MTRASNSLTILNELLERARERELSGLSRDFRSDTLIRDPDGAALDWYMYVDKRFNKALAIELTTRVGLSGKSEVWTQGTNFSFSTGDIIYGSHAAYEPWNPRKVVRCFSITSAYPASSAIRETPDGRFLAGSRGQVTFYTWRPNSLGTDLEVDGVARRMTQDEFVRLLIAGPKV